MFGKNILKQISYGMRVRTRIYPMQLLIDAVAVRFVVVQRFIFPTEDICTGLCVCVCVCLCMHMCMCMCVCIFVCVGG